MNWVFLVCQLDDCGDIINVLTATMSFAEAATDRDAMTEPGAWCIIKFKTPSDYIDVE